MIRRLGLWTLAMLICVDHFAYVWLAGWIYVWTGKCDCPSSDETISACVGYHAELGRTWALAAERLINAMFWFKPNHCRSAIIGDERRASEVPVDLGAAS